MRRRPETVDSQTLLCWTDPAEGRRGVVYKLHNPYLDCILCTNLHNVFAYFKQHMGQVLHWWTSVKLWFRIIGLNLKMKQHVSPKMSYFIILVVFSETLLKLSHHHQHYIFSSCEQLLHLHCASRYRTAASVNSTLRNPVDLVSMLWVYYILSLFQCEQTTDWKAG